MKKNDKTNRMTGKSIKDQILIQIGRLVVLVLLVVAVISISQMWYMISSAKEKELTLESQSTAYQLSDFFDGFEKMTAQMAVNPDIKALLRNTEAGKNIKYVTGFNAVFNNLYNIAGTDAENILATWIGDSDASVITQSDGYTSGEGWDITSRPWYVCTELGTTVLTEPYIDASTGQLILSVASPIYDANGATLGVAGIDLSLNQVTSVMQAQKIGEEGYIILISAEGLVVYHPKAENVLANIAEIGISENVVAAVQNAEEGFLQFSEGGVKKYGYLVPVAETGYMVLSSLPSKEYFSQVKSAVMMLLFVFVTGMILVILGMRKTADKIIKPIQELNATAQQLAEGNLEVELNVTSEDEIGELGQSIGATVTRLKEYIVYIDEIAEVLTKMANGKLAITLKQDYVGEFQKVKEALLNISTSMTDVMTGINESAAQVSAGADELANGSQSLAESAGTQAAAVEELLATVTSIAAQVESNKKDAEDAAKETEKVTAMMEGSQEQMKLMTEAMETIRKTSEQVVGIIAAIEEIADQTNLLSLNASIEAARAGEAGKGFAVVAGEIGKLSDESAKAVNITRSLINESMNEIAKGNSIVEGVVGSIQTSVEAIESVNEMIQNTSDNAVSQAMNMEQIRMGIEEVSMGIQDSSAIAEESSATSEELAAQATTLNEMVQKFEV